MATAIPVCPSPDSDNPQELALDPANADSQLRELHSAIFLPEVSVLLLK